MNFIASANRSSTLQGSTQIIYGSGSGITSQGTSNFGSARISYQGNDIVTALLLHCDGTNNGTTFTDSSGYNHTILNAGSVITSTTTSNFGTASLYTPGTVGNYYLSVSSNALMIDTNNFTIEFWMNPATPTVTQRLMGNLPLGSFNSGAWAMGFTAADNGKFHIDVFNISGAGVQTLTATTAMTANTWNHIAFARYSNVWTLYQNGIVQASKTTLSNVSLDNGGAARPVYIGWSGFSTSSTAEYYNGYLDEIRITNGIAIYTPNFNVATVPFTIDESTVLLMHCDGTNGSTTFTDSSTNNATLTSYNSAQISTFIYKFSSSSLYLPYKLQSYVLTPSSTNYTFGTGDFTIEFWLNWLGLYSTSGNGWQRVMSNKTGGFTTNNWIIGWDNLTNNGTAHIGMQFFNVGGTPFYSSTSILVPNTWYHFAFVRYGTNFYVYTNGILEGTYNISTTNVDGGIACPLTIGGNPGESQYFYGYLDEIRVTKGLARYIGNFTPPTLPFTLTWPTTLYLPGIGGSYTNLGPCPATFNTTNNNFFFETWVYLNRTTTSTTDYYIFQIGTGQWASEDIGLRIIGGNCQFYTYLTSGSVTTIPSNLTFYAGVWYHIACAITTTGTSCIVYLFVNGSLQNSGGTTLSAAPRTTTNRNFYIGTPLIQTDWIAANLFIQDIRVVQGGAVPTANFTPVSAPFTMRSPTYISGMGQTVLSLYYQYLSPTYLLLPGISGSYMDLSTNTTARVNTSTTNMFLETWCYFNSFPYTGKEQYIAGVITISTQVNDDWGLRWDAPANALQFYHYNTGNGAGSVYSVAPLILKTWYHIAVSVRSTGYIYLYINGILQNAGGTSISGTPKYTPSSTLWLGSPGNVGWGPSTVYIQDLRIISGGNVPISTFNPSSAPFGNGIPSYTYGMGQTVFSLASQYMTNTISLTSPSLTSSTALATGGDTINIINGNRIHTFTTVGTQTFTVGSNTIQNAQILIVAGGGGGGPISTAAGGGAGGLIYLNSISLSNGSYTVTVGAGGNPGSAGGNSVFGTYTALGGGTAGGGANSPGGNGGSGGGSTNGVAVGSSTQPPSGGNTITISSNNRIHTFTTVGTQTFTVPSGLTIQAQILIVGGGGGAGYDGGGGGGGGGVIYYSNVSIPAGSYTVTVGGGGAAATGNATNGVNGGNSSISGLGLSTALGGAGGMDGHALSVTALTGGCGGGGGFSQNPDIGIVAPLGYGTVGQGFNGGAAYYNSAGGGGGGAGDIGGNAANALGGNGGIGIINNISGTNTYYGGGGAGGSWNGTGGTGGLGGGGNAGGSVAGSHGGTSGTVNTGGGGGGNGFADTAPGSGGSGIVIISYNYLSINTGYFGNAGGSSANAANYGTGGGGGAGTVGTTGTTTLPGNGGDGLLYSISGTPTYYAGGGGGGWNGATYGGYGGLGGGGNGGNNATAGKPNTGGGGGGTNNSAGSTNVSGAGGSGIVIISYPYSGTLRLSGFTLSSQLSTSAINSAFGIFSLRSLYSRSAKVINVRRSTDNSTQDFYGDRYGNLLTSPITGTSIANWLNGAKGYITSWYDQSTQNNNASQATSANQPTISLSGLNNKPMVFWGGINNIILTATNGINTPTFTAVMVLNMAMKTTNIQQWFNTTTYVTGSLSYTSQQNLRNIYVQTSPSAGTQVSYTYSDNVPFIFIIVGTVSGGNGVVTPYINGTAYAADSASGVTNFLMQSMGIGGWAGNGVCTYNGGMSDVYMYSTALSTTDRQYIEGYLAWKVVSSGSILPVNHPYYNNAPIDM